jgi:hypothetical protein
MDKTWVIAAKGRNVPKESAPRVYIDDTAPVQVPRNIYYLRRIADGELLETAAPATTTTKTEVK